MVDKAWTSEEAWAEQLAFAAANPSKPRGPYFAWLALRQLDQLQADFLTGDTSAPLHALYVCSLDELQIPEWAARAFINQYSDGLEGKLSSWDKAFGRPPNRNKVRRHMRNVELMPRVWDLVVEAKAKGESIGTQLFERIAEKLNTNRDKVAKSYAAYRRLIDRRP